MHLLLEKESSDQKHKIENSVRYGQIDFFCLISHKRLLRGVGHRLECQPDAFCRVDYSLVALSKYLQLSAFLSSERVDLISISSTAQTIATLWLCFSGDP